MCTLVIGRDVLGPRTLVAGTNRDESPERPSEPPRILERSPRIVGGRDARAGGTWLAVRTDRAAGPAAVALLNRRDPDRGRLARRSRGLLTLEVARAEDPRTAAAAAAANGDYAPFSLVWMSADACWCLARAHGRPPVLADVPSGWHVLTHADLDDPDEPRTAWIAARLAGERPTDRRAVEALVGSILASHGADGAPPVCLHDGPMPTVSAAILGFGGGPATYRHAEGPPCRTPFDDHSHWLAPGPPTEDTP